MDIKIRHILEKDYQRIKWLAREAFWNLYEPGAVEHYIVHQLKQHPDYLPSLSFVIEVDGVIEGAIFYTTSIIEDEGKKEDVVTFGPVFINPKKHRQGLGRRLIEYSISEAKKQGHQAIVIMGYPYHYACYGFVGAKKYHIAMLDGQYYVGLLALPLIEDGLKLKHATISFSDVYDVDQQAAEAFDALLPFKQKEVLPCQQTFIETATLIDDTIYSEG